MRKDENSEGEHATTGSWTLGLFSRPCREALFHALVHDETGGTTEDQLGDGKVEVHRPWPSLGNSHLCWAQGLWSGPIAVAL